MSMLDDYLDPDRYETYSYEDALYEEVKDILKLHDLKNWKACNVDCSVTHRDSDLESYGQQGLELVGIEDNYSDKDCVTAEIKIHCYKTIAGNSVCLNFPESEQEERLEEYLEITQELMSGSSFAGDWDGDSWSLYGEFVYFVDLPFIDDGDHLKVDSSEGWDIIYKEYQRTVEDWDNEMGELDTQRDVASGWKCFDEQREEYVSVKPYEEKDL